MSDSTNEDEGSDKDLNRPDPTETSPRKATLRKLTPLAYYPRKFKRSDCKVVLPLDMSLKENNKTVLTQPSKQAEIKYSPSSSQGSEFRRKCQLCGKGFGNLKSLSDHRKVCKGSPETAKRKVSASGRKILVSTLDRVAKVHASSPPSSGQQSLTVETIQSGNSIGIWMSKTCERCGKDFTTPKQSSNHRKTCMTSNIQHRIPMNKLKSLPKETSFQCYVCFKMIPRQNYSEHLLKEYNNPWYVIDNIQKKAMRPKKTPGPGFVFHCQRCPTLTYFPGEMEIAKHANENHKGEEED